MQAVSAQLILYQLCNNLVTVSNILILKTHPVSCTHYPVSPCITLYTLLTLLVTILLPATHQETPWPAPACPSTVQLLQPSSHSTTTQGRKQSKELD